ncbi:SDR family oxidoreductase [Actinophytocola gossypii]|uniref:SDR family oxidoreductase n=1 Tax=Actinophytocola gossypii TaxID=2812003 RepID=A0ABT2JB33_9PSEU|nr:SDR family oxidoreductase [Actinophytocola gossypii]MCT2585089.1 SDR family oxidoreductase [Actinophytocola gossypii]
MSAKRRQVESGGVRLAVFERGDPGAPTVVLVHGYPDNSHVWDRVADRLAERFHVVTYDVRGHGESSTPEHPDGYRMAELVADLHTVIRAVSSEPVHLVAHDWGSVQAWPALEPDLIRSFTSLSGPHLGHVGEWLRGWRRRPLAVARQSLHSWYIAAFRVPVLPELAWRVLRGRFRADYRDARNGLQLYRTNMFRRHETRRVTVPVQQVALTGDPFVTTRLLEAAEPWCERLYRRDLVAGHWAPRTHPDAVARMITDFVEHVDGAPAARELARARVGERREPLAGQLALVTGAGSGIGRATAVALGRQGARVLCADIDFAGAERTAADVGGAAFQVDVADEAGMRRLAEHVTAEYGVVDLLMANAGVGVSGPFLDTSVEDWRRVLDVNLWGVIHTLRAFLPGMVDRGEGGHVVVTSSAAGYFATPSLPAYGTTKAAVLMLAQCLAGELRPAGVGVSAICPGFVHTNIAATSRFAGAGVEEERRRQASADAAYRKRGYGPEKVANAVLRAVRDDRLVVPVTPEARVGALGARFLPGTTRALGRWMNTQARKL